VGMRISWSDRMSNRRHVASSEPVANANPFGKYCNEQTKDDWLGFSGTFGAKKAVLCLQNNEFTWLLSTGHVCDIGRDKFRWQMSSLLFMFIYSKAVFL